MVLAKWLGLSATVRVRDREWAFRVRDKGWPFFWLSYKVTNIFVVALSVVSGYPVSSRNYICKMDSPTSSIPLFLSCIGICCHY